MKAHTGLQFRVFYLWDFGVAKRHDPQFGTSFAWDVDLLSGYDNEIVPNVAKRPGAERFFGYDNPGLEERLAAWSPDALLLFGYKWASHLRVIRWARRKGIPLLFRGDSHLLGRGRPRLHVRLALRLLFSRFSSFLYVGAANREYFEAFGVPREKLFFAPHSVNAELFNRESHEHQQASEALRSQLGIPLGPKVVLFAGKFDDLWAQRNSEL
jgi:glycosyltransferase involved in cell wall biosynthesis